VGADYWALSQKAEDVTSKVKELTMIDTRSLKRLATKLLPESSTFRRVVMEENDSIPATDYVAKLGT
jgi:hypothetical protein